VAQRELWQRRLACTTPATAVWLIRGSEHQGRLLTGNGCGPERARDPASSQPGDSAAAGALLPLPLPPPSIHSPGRGSSRLQFCRGRLPAVARFEKSASPPAAGSPKVSSRRMKPGTLAAHTSGGGISHTAARPPFRCSQKALICFSSRLFPPRQERKLPGHLGLAALQGMPYLAHRGSGLQPVPFALPQEIGMGLSLEESSDGRTREKEGKAGKATLANGRGAAVFVRASPGLTLVWFSGP